MLSLVRVITCFIHRIVCLCLHIYTCVPAAHQSRRAAAHNIHNTTQEQRAGGSRTHHHPVSARQPGSLRRRRRVRDRRCQALAARCTLPCVHTLCCLLSVERRASIQQSGCGCGQKCRSCALVAQRTATLIAVVALRCLPSPYTYCGPRSSSNLGICTGQSVSLFLKRVQQHLGCCFMVFCPRLQSRTHRYGTSQDEAEIKLSLDMHLHKDLTRIIRHIYVCVRCRFHALPLVISNIAIAICVQGGCSRASTVQRANSPITRLYGTRVSPPAQPLKLVI